MINLIALQKGSYQWIFNKAYRHFIINKNPRSYNEESCACMYRDGKGNKCAIGLFIPDDVYHPSLEQCTFKRLIHDKHISPVSDEKHEFLGDLQAVHDLHNTYEKMEKAFNALAKHYSLRIPTK